MISNFFGTCRESKIYFNYIDNLENILIFGYHHFWCTINNLNFLYKLRYIVSTVNFSLINLTPNYILCRIYSQHSCIIPSV